MFSLFISEHFYFAGNRRWPCRSGWNTERRQTTFRKYLIC